MQHPTPDALLEAAARRGWLDPSGVALDPNRDPLVQLIERGLLSAEQVDLLRTELGNAAAVAPTLVPSATVAEGPVTWSQAGTERLTRPEAAPERYEREDELGRGGMGVVTREYDRQLERHVAKKVMLGGDPGQLARFVREAKLTARLDHPGMPPVHDLGVDAEGAFFTMKLVRGDSLETLLLERPPSRTERLEIFLKVCDAMRYAHAAGVLHRDLKPANIMVGAFGEVLVMDWGLAKRIGETEEDDARRAGPPVLDGNGELTLDGQIVGTPSYMPPEQANGEIDALDARTDVWSLGALLFHLLFDRAPYDGDSLMAILARAQDGRVAWPERGDVAPELVAIARKAMAAEPADRYQDVAALATDVRHFRDHRSVSAYRDTLVGQVTKLVRRHPTAAAISALIVVGLAVAARVEQARAREQARAASLARKMLADEQVRRKANEARRKAVVPYAEAQRLLRHQPTRATLLDRVIPLLEASRAADASFGQATATLAELRLALGDPTAAESLLTSLVESAPTAQAIFDLVRARTTLGRLDDARATLGRAPADSAVAVAGRAWIAQAAELPEDARREAAKLLTRADEETRGPWRRLAWAGHWVEASVLFDPDSGITSARALPHLDRVILEAPAFPRARVRRARLRYQLGDRKLAAADLDVARQLIPDDFDLRLLDARLASAFDRSDAIALIDGFLADRPGDPHLLGLRIRTLHASNRRGEARKAYTELARRVMPSPTVDQALVLANLGPTIGTYPTGLFDAIGRLIQQQPQRRGPLYLAHGELLWRLGKGGLAQRAFRAAADAIPDDPRPTLKLAQLLSRLGKSQDAVQLFEQLAERHPTDSRVGTAYAVVIARLALKDPAYQKPAAEVLARAMERSPENPTLLVHRARLRNRAGNLIAAEQDFLLACAVAERTGQRRRLMTQLVELALFQERRHDYARAANAWHRFVLLAPPRERRLEAAKEKLRQCQLLVALRTREPRNTEERGLKGRLLREAGQFADALRYLEQAVQELEASLRTTDVAHQQTVLRLRLERVETLYSLRQYPRTMAEAKHLTERALRLVRQLGLKDTAAHNMREFARLAALTGFGAAVKSGSTDAAFAILAEVRTTWPEHLRSMLLSKTGRALRDDPRWRQLLESTRRPK